MTVSVMKDEGWCVIRLEEKLKVRAVWEDSGVAKVDGGVVK